MILVASSLRGRARERIERRARFREDTRESRSTTTMIDQSCLNNDEGCRRGPIESDLCACPDTATSFADSAMRWMTSR
jgi:hypothetical protein